MKTTFPELNRTLEERYDNMDMEDITYIEWFKEKSAPFAEYLTKKDKLVFNSKLHKDGFFLFPDVDFVRLWKCKISINTKNAIWKYLHLLLLLVSHYQLNTSDFETTFKEWDTLLDNSNVPPEELDKMKNYAENIMKLMKNLSCPDEEDDDEQNEDETVDTPDDTTAEAIKNDPFLQKLQDSKIAKFAEELTKELDLPNELGLSGKSSNLNSSINDVFSTFGKDPSKLMGLVNSVGSKIQTKLNTGDIQQTELVEEAHNLMSAMKDSPSFKKMFKGGKKGRQNTGNNMDPQSLFNMISKMSGMGDANMNPDDIQKMMASVTSNLQNVMTPPTNNSAQSRQNHSATTSQNRLRQKLASRDKSKK